MGEWFKKASSTMAGTAAALALLAIPTYLWLPREFDRIDERLEVVEEAVGASGGVTVSDKLDDLILAFAAYEAQPVPLRTQDVLGEVLASSDNGGFWALFPPDLSQAIAKTDLSGWKHLRFGETEYVFVDAKTFNTLDSAKQEAILSALERQNAVINIGIAP